MTVSLRKPTDERWKVIPGYEPYEASTYGRIRSKDGKILKPSYRGPKRKSYLVVYVGGGRKASKKYVHKLILKTFIGEIPENPLGLHKDDNQYNNYLSNLYWGTHKNNNQDCINNGNHKPIHGEKNALSKYSNDLIEKIKTEFTGKRGEQTRLARKYNMSISNVNYIVRGETRKNG